MLLALRDRLADPADLLVGYLTAYALFRLWVETTRTNDVLALGLTGSQWVVLLVAAAAAGPVHADPPARAASPGTRRSVA